MPWLLFFTSKSNMFYKKKPFIRSTTLPYEWLNSYRRLKFIFADTQVETYPSC